MAKSSNGNGGFWAKRTGGTTNLKLRIDGVPARGVVKGKPADGSPDALRAALKGKFVEVSVPCGGEFQDVDKKGNAVKRREGEYRDVIPGEEATEYLAGNAA
jgi:hypothetical protein